MRFDTWDDFMAEQRRTGLLDKISSFVLAERARATNYRRQQGLEVGDRGCIDVYPPSADVFAFTTTPLRDVKVVILGQDPYHQPGQADGLAFSVRAGTKPLPPSLRNIFEELWRDLVETVPEKPQVTYPCGDLTPWTRQGVLLLNTALTVRHGEAGSHLDIWQPFTDEVIRAVIDSAVVAPHFVLWGRHAKDTFARALDKRLIGQRRTDEVFCTTQCTRTITYTRSAHPSPLSADRGFFGSRPFSRANLALTLNNPGCAPVDWRLS